MNTFERFAPAIAVYFAGCAMVPLVFAAVSAAMGWRLMAAFGAFGIAALLGFFSAAAVLAGASGTLVVAGCGAWLSPVSLIAAWVCWYDR